MLSKSKLSLLIAAGCGIAGFWFGTGLSPTWPMLWLGIVSTLFAARRLRPLRAGFLGFSLFFVGGLNLWDYLSFLPGHVRILLIGIPAIAFGASTSFFSAFAGNPKRLALATLAPAATWVSFEFLYSIISPHGTFGSLGYTQVNFLPWLQLSSVGGLWLMDFLMIALSSAAALLFGSNVPLPNRRRLATVCIIVCVACLGGGLLRLKNAPRQPSVLIAALASDTEKNLDFRAPAASEEIIDRYLAELEKLSGRGVRWAVLPEHLVSLRDAGESPNTLQIDSKMRASAQRLSLNIVVGVDHYEASGTIWNEARIYAADGSPPQTYVKQHLLPGFESIYSAGTHLTTLDDPVGKIGFAICKDLDFTHVGRDYANAGAQLLIVPAFDFTVDAWLHSRMAVVRSVESGLSMARSAKKGDLTFSTSRGQIVASQLSNNGEFSVLVAELPIGDGATLYSRFGNWAGWTSVGLFLIALCNLMRGAKTQN